MKTSITKYRKVSPDHITVSGKDLTIEDRETGRLYVSKKAYLDKLFKEMGYKNLNVIKIIDEFAGKVVSEIGSLTNSSIYLNDLDETFIVVSDTAVNWINNLYSYMDSHDYEVLDLLEKDPYMSKVQIRVKSNTGTIFMLYPNFVKEEMNVYSTCYSKEGVLVGLLKEDTYKFAQEDTLKSLTTLMDNPIDIGFLYDYKQCYSIRETMEFLHKLNYVKSIRKTGLMALTDLAEEYLKSREFDFEELIEEFNSMTWIQRVINSTSYTLLDLSLILHDNIDRVYYEDFSEFFSKNDKNLLDLCALNA